MKFASNPWELVGHEGNLVREIKSVYVVNVDAQSFVCETMEEVKVIVKTVRGFDKIIIESLYCK